MSADDFEKRCVMAIGVKTVRLKNEHGKYSDFPRGRIAKIKFDTPAMARVYFRKERTK